MFIPLISTKGNKTTKLALREPEAKGGGGLGKGAGKGTASSKGPSISGSKGINFAGTSKSTSLYGFGGGRTSYYPVVPSPGPSSHFSGREVGGGNRSSIYGSRQYGSGYPGLGGRGVNGRGFPYYFWPIVWVSALALSASSVGYLYSSEYGLPGDMDRPGGVLVNAAFKSASMGTVYRVLSDNLTVVALFNEINANCTSSIGDSNLAPVANTSDSSEAQPEQAVQYYRASSVVLTLDGYNNSAIFGPEGTPDTQLPNSIDMNLLNCINTTVGLAVPLVNGTPTWKRTKVVFPSIGSLLIWVLVLNIYSHHDLGHVD